MAWVSTTTALLTAKGLLRGSPILGGRGEEEEGGERKRVGVVVVVVVVVVGGGARGFHLLEQ